MPGSTPAGSPLRAFGLRGSDREAKGASQLEWRRSFGDLWSQVALGDLIGCADALCSLRARWLELAVGMWLIVHALDDLLATATFGVETRLKVAVSSRACSALLASRLREQPGNFDHRQAWDRQREALHELTRDVCLALQTGEPDAFVCAQQLSLRRLARALAAIWTIDERLRSPQARTGQRCL